MKGSGKVPRQSEALFMRRRRLLLGFRLRHVVAHRAANDGAGDPMVFWCDYRPYRSPGYMAFCQRGLCTERHG
jgi:hypothetical protein